MTNRNPQILSCFLCIALAFLFASMGLAKLVAPAAAEQTFASWGFPGWFHILIGCLEAVGALLLVFKPTTTLAAALLGGVALGAVATHLHEGEFIKAILPGTLLVPIACVGFCRRLEAPWMRRLGGWRTRAVAEFAPVLANDDYADDDSIVPGSIPELRLSGRPRHDRRRRRDFAAPTHQRRA